MTIKKGHIMARSFALFVSLLTVLNLIGNLVWPGFDASGWWIGLGVLPSWMAQILLALCALVMLVFALLPRPSARILLTTTVVATGFAAVALVNTATFYWLLARGRISAGVPVPFTLLIAAGLVLVARASYAGRQAPQPQNWRRVALGSCCLFALFPLALMLFFGNTDYRRPADVAVVLGARVYPDGRMSDALEDRIRTGCELYRAGLAKKLVLSGGLGDGPVTEAGAMRRYALSHGVPEKDIFIDDHGHNTEATVRDTVPLFRQWGASRVLAVSHFYHLPRVKLAYQRAGFNVCTVPARQAHVLVKLPFNMAREVAAFWSYYFKERPLRETAG
jgi:uncharacterized SAM-binding protein YcdF (DUF218 family)